MQVSPRGSHLRSSDLDRWMALLHEIQIAPIVVYTQLSDWASEGCFHTEETPKCGSFLRDFRALYMPEKGGKALLAENRRY